MKNNPYLEEYNNYLIKNNYSKSAITGYITGLKLFFKYLSDNNIDINYMNLININDFIDASNNTHSKSTQSVYLNGVKNYLIFIKNHYNFKLNFDLNNIKQIKLVKKINKNIDIKEINNFLNNINVFESPSSKRDYLIIQLIIKTGMRISDLINIKKDDIIENKIIMNSNKYIIDDKIIKLIKDAIKESDDNSIYLFTAFSKNIGDKTNHLTNRSVERMIKKYFRNYSYNDLKSIYYKSLIDKLPNITQIYKHLENTAKINLQEINNII